MASKKAKKNQEHILYLLMGIIIIGLIIAGFFLFKKQFSGMFKSNEPVETAEKQVETVKTAEVKKTESKEIEEEYIPQEEVQNIQIFYGVKGKDKIEAEKKRVRKNPMLIGRARQIVNALIDKPTNERLYKLMPDEMTLRGIFYDKGLFIIDFSREFKKIFSYGANEQILAIYSIVNSLTELDPKAQVRFLINGTEPEGEEGHIDLSVKLSRLESIIEK